MSKKETVIPGIGHKVKPGDDANLPALRSETFDLTVNGGIQLDPALAAAIDNNDYTGFETPRESLPICSIRQKPLIDKSSGKTIENGGGFKVYDAVSKGADLHIADVDGEKGLLITVMLDQSTRTYWASMNDPKPACKSFDGLNGTGKPGGSCALCPLSQFHDDKRPECSSEMNLLVWDHHMGSSYVLRLGRSAIKPYNLFKTMVKRSGNGNTIPLHALMVRVTTKYESDPAPHYTPTFEIEGQAPVDLFLKLKAMRQEMKSIMQATSRIDTHDDEHPAATPTEYSELPEGVDPINNEPTPF